MKHSKMKMVNADPSVLQMMEKCYPVDGRFKGLVVGRTKKGYYAELLINGSARTVSMPTLGDITDEEIKLLWERE